MSFWKKLFGGQTTKTNKPDEELGDFQKMMDRDINNLAKQALEEKSGRKVSDEEAARFADAMRAMRDLND